MGLLTENSNTIVPVECYDLTELEHISISIASNLHKTHSGRTNRTDNQSHGPWTENRSVLFMVTKRNGPYMMSIF